MPDIFFEEISSNNSHVGMITLSRPQVLNALNHKMFLDLEQQLVQWANNPSLKAVIIRAVPGRAFCAGGDIRQVYELAKQGDTQRIPLFFRDEYRLNHRIYHYPKPYIALLNGMTMGGGAGISIHGAHRVATENLVFAMPETGIGFFPDVGSSYFLSRLPSRLGFYIALTGVRISAADCFLLGLANYFILSDSLSALVNAIIETPFESNDTVSIAKIMAKFSARPAPSLLQEHKDKIIACFSKNSVEEILYALESDGSEWCQQTANQLKTKSPTSLKITFRELCEAEKNNFDDCINMEYRLTNHFVRGHDFYEGVRAVIVDKDQKPRWQPSSLAEVSEQQVNEYFKPLAEELIS